MERYRKVEPSLTVFLRDKSTVRSLFTPNKGPNLLYLARQLNSKLDDEKRTSDVCTLIDGLGKDDNVWDVNRRDGALLLLKQVNLDKTDTTLIKDTYINAVSKQDQNSDPLGSIDALLDAGYLLVPYFAKDNTKKLEIKREWKLVVNGLKKKPEWQVVAPKYAEFVHLLGPVIIFDGKKRVRKKTETVSLKSQAFSDEIVRRWNDGQTAKIIGEAIGMSDRAVYKAVYKLKKNGVGFEQREKIMSLKGQARSDEIVRRWNNGESAKAIGDAIGMSSRAVTNAISRLRKTGVNLEHREKIVPLMGQARSDEIVKRWNNGESAKAIGEAIGISSVFVHSKVSRLRKKGIDLEQRRKT